MARNLTPRTKLSRRVNRNLFLMGARSFSAKDDYTKKPFKATLPGKRRPASSSEYSKQLTEKQALKFTYGLMEKQLSNLFKKSFKATGDTGLMALGLLEKRLDNVIYRGGLANSRSQARQLVNHGHFEVNGVRTNIPSFTVKPGDKITIVKSKQKSVFWTNFSLEVPNGVPTWLEVSNKNSIQVVNNPISEDLPKEFNLPYIVEFYSRKVS